MSTIRSKTRDFFRKCSTLRFILSLVCSASLSTPSIILWSLCVNISPASGRTKIWWFCPDILFVWCSIPMHGSCLLPCLVMPLKDDEGRRSIYLKFTFPGWTIKAINSKRSRSRIILLLRCVQQATVNKLVGNQGKLNDHCLTSYMRAVIIRRRWPHLTWYPDWHVWLRSCSSCNVLMKCILYAYQVHITLYQ